MARFAALLALAGTAGAYVAPVAPKVSASALKASPLDGLEGGQVPLGNWDPLNLADTTQFGPTLEWYRAAELKHCRVAMAAFVGMVLQANGWVFPGNIAPGVTFKSCVGATPLDTWDNVPLYGKYQIIAWVGLMELCTEIQKPHYLMGGKAAPRTGTSGI
ncbi:chlorophyll A-B binding protein [Aureococcus anophagefferens]|nr:chlorophyll A-B binding protein [Aureococcus anophagefferens]